MNVVVVRWESRLKNQPVVYLQSLLSLWNYEVHIIFIVDIIIIINGWFDYIFSVWMNVFLRAISFLELWNECDVFFYAVYSVLLSIVACLWVFTLKRTIPLFYCPSQVVFHSINYSIIVFSSIPLIIFLQFQDSISAPACHPAVPLTKIFRSIILILRRICLNFQQ